MESLPHQDSRKPVFTSEQARAFVCLVRAKLNTPEGQAKLATIRLRLQRERSSSQTDPENNQIAVGGN